MTEEKLGEYTISMNLQLKGADPEKLLRKAMQIARERDFDVSGITFTRWTIDDGDWRLTLDCDRQAQPVTESMAPW